MKGSGAGSRPSGGGRLHGEVQVTADPAAAYARLVAAALGEHAGAGRPFRLAVSGGSSGERCLEALLALDPDWSAVSLYFADERCVPFDDERSNAGAVRRLLGAASARLSGFRPMSCAAGPAAYEAELRAAGGLDLVQLGFGPDGHTASLFPGSPALDAAPGALVAANSDPSGRNPLQRMTLTFEAIAATPTVVVVVAGAEKHDALAALLAGDDLPAGRVRAGGRLVWLVDEAATAAGLREALQA